MKNKNENMKNKPKKIKFFIFVVALLTLAILTGCGVFYYLYINGTDKVNNTAYIGIFDDGTYYIAQAEPDILFEIDSDDDESYKLTDSDSNTVKSSVIEKKGKYYIKPKEEYEEGKTYYLELVDTNFVDEALEDAKKVEFKIKREEVADCEFSDNVITVDEDDIKIDDSGKLNINNNDLEEGQIILVEDEDGINNAYKISSIDGNIASTIEPEIYEIYDDINLYENGKVNFENLKINKDAEIEIEKSIEESSLFKFLAEDVYAATAETPKVTFSINGNEMTIKVSFKFKADGEKKLGIDSLKDHDLSFTLSYTTSINYMADVEKDFSINYDMSLTTVSCLEIELESGNSYLKGISNISDAEYSKSVQEIVEKLQDEVPDASENSIDIGAIEIPTSIPGINVYFDIYFQDQLSVLINLKFNGEIETIQHVGFIMSKDENKSYRNASQSIGSWDISLVGKAEIKVGIGLDCGISFINKDLAHAEIGIEFGVYNEYFATTSVAYNGENDGIDAGIYAKIELGIYLKAKVECSVNVFFAKSSFKADLDEVKQPFLKLETGVEWLNSDKNDGDDSTSTSSESNSGSSESTTANNKSSSSSSSSENITQEQALVLAQQIWGEDTGFTYAGWGMDANGKKYYIFDARWVVEDHFSYIGTICIAFDGKSYKQLDTCVSDANGETFDMLDGGVIN